MSLNRLQIPSGKIQARQPTWYDAEAPSLALEEWTERVYASESDDPNTISIYGPIGESWFEDGFSVKKASGILRAIGAKPITVNINSPGGNVFDGLAIYDLLREHPAKVTVHVRGLAASAASVIAMAGDEITMGVGSIMMIHKAWGITIGNRDDFEEAVNIFDTIDRSMSAIYAARTGLNEAEIMQMLAGPTRKSDGTWMTAEEAVEKKFADSVSTVDETPSARVGNADREKIVAKRRIEASLAKDGLSRRERAAIFEKALTPRDASQDDTERDAGNDFGRLFSEAMQHLRVK